MSERAHPGRYGCGGAAAGPARRARRVPRIERASIKRVGCEKARAEWRNVCPPAHDRSGLAPVRNWRTIDLGDTVLERLDAIGRGAARVVDIDLDCDGDPMQRADCLS